MIFWWLLTFSAMRGLSVKVPQSRVTFSGAPATFSPEVGICDMSCAQAPAASTSAAAPATATTLLFIRSICFPPN